MSSKSKPQGRSPLEVKMSVPWYKSASHTIQKQCRARQVAKQQREAHERALTRKAHA